MTEDQSPTDRRLSDRFNVSNSAVALLRPGLIQVGQITEISKSGMVMQYYHRGEPSLEATEVDIMLTGSSDEIIIEKLPIQIVSDVALTEADIPESRQLRKRAIAFRSLSPEQQTEVGKFIRLFSSTIV
jgi:hypothetical protein